MSEDPTKEQLEPRSFEERVFARFDALDARLSALESQAERRALETKPVWERALVEIIEVNRLVASIERKLTVLAKDMIDLRADQHGLEARMERIERAH